MIRDLHRHTVYHDETFHAHMDNLARVGIVTRTWRNWGFRRIRMYAKQWNFQRLYGIAPGTMTGRIPEIPQKKT